MKTVSGLKGRTYYLYEEGIDDLKTTNKMEWGARHKKELKGQDAHDAMEGVILLVKEHGKVIVNILDYGW